MDVPKPTSKLLARRGLEDGKTGFVFLPLLYRSVCYVPDAWDSQAWRPSRALQTALTYDPTWWPRREKAARTFECRRLSQMAAECLISLADTLSEVPGGRWDRPFAWATHTLAAVRLIEAAQRCEALVFMSPPRMMCTHEPYQWGHVRLLQGLERTGRCGIC